MSIPQGLILFPGILHPLSGSYVLTHGTTPGVATIVIAPQALDSVPQTGTLTISYGGDTLVFPDSRLIDGEQNFDQQGYERWMLHIADGRWRWRYGTINGRFNIRYLDRELLTIAKRSIKTSRELAALLFKAMGVKRYDLSELPDGDFPPMEWEYTTPATALDQLVANLGCRVIYGPNQYVAIRRTGFGNALPTGALMQMSFGFDPSELPDALTFVAGRTLYECDLKLEPVGLERDLSIKHIDQLSYRPDNGWFNENGRTGFQSIRGVEGITPVDARGADLATESVYRWYRIKNPIECFKGRDFWGHQRDKIDLWRILPILSTQLRRGSFADATTGNIVSRELPAWVWGKFWSGHSWNRENVTRLVGLDVNQDFERLARLTDSESNRTYYQGYNVDVEHGIVKFSDAMFREEAGAQGDPKLFLPAELYLRVAYGLKDEETQQFTHYELSTPTGLKNGTNPQYFLRGEIGLRKRMKDKKGVQGVLVADDNLSEINDVAKYYTENILRELQFKSPSSAQYAGFVNIQPDGAIQQVRWWCGEDGFAYTHATRHTELPQLSATYLERRFYSKVNSFLSELDRVPTKELKSAMGQWFPGGTGANL